MPTRRGWALVLSSVVVGVGGRLLAIRELFLVATAGVVLVVVAVAFVHCRPVRLEARRRLAPTRVSAGGWCRVVLTVGNRGRLPTPPVIVQDGGAAPVALAVLAAGGTADVDYRLDAPKRGLVSVGPLRATVVDPFGFASHRVHALSSSTLVVHPVVEVVDLPPDRSGASAPARPSPSPVPGGEFHSLRPYEAGDDVRLVHWPSSARLDALVVRQDEAPRSRRWAVALDARGGVHTKASFERAVSVAAGVAGAACATDGVVRLVTTAGLDSGTAGGDGHLEEVLDLLAALEPDRATALGPMASLLAGEEDTTLVVVTTGAGAAAGLGALAGPLEDAATSVAVVVDARSSGASAAASVPFGRMVAVAPGAPWRQAWDSMVAAPVGGEQ